jgi:Thioredoxin
MIPLLVLVLAALAPSGRDQQDRGVADGAAALAVFDKGQEWSSFLAAVTTQRERWTANAARGSVPPDLARRLQRTASGLRLLIVAQDWCIDSANTVPYIARLATSAGVPVRIVDRAAGAPMLERYRTRDGRSVTPLVVLLRQKRVDGVWVERPAPLQRFFASMVSDVDARRQFENRQAWYDKDAGRTTMMEIVELAERRTGR